MLLSLPELLYFLVFLFQTEINECDAEPCMHGGNCTDRVNDFQCTCPEGWTGKRCEMIYDECTVNNKCPSSAQCLNIFKKSYCK